MSSRGNNLRKKLVDARFTDYVINDAPEDSSLSKSGHKNHNSDNTHTESKDDAVVGQQRRREAWEVASKATSQFVAQARQRAVIRSVLCDERASSTREEKQDREEKQGPS
jgi:hypothetical protein